MKGPYYVGKWKWKKTVSWREVQAKGYKEERIFGANASACEKATFYVSPAVFGMRKRVMKFGSQLDLQFFPDWKPCQEVTITS